MKSKKVTMLAAALVVAVVAFAGVGYAAVTQYKATTTNDANSASTTYITLTQGGSAKYDDASFLDKLYFNSYNVESGTSYSPIFDFKTESAEGVTTLVELQTAKDATELAADGVTTLTNYYSRIGKDLTLTVAPTNSKADSFDLKITVLDNKFTPIAGLTYTFMLTKTTGSGSTTTVTVYKTGAIDSTTWATSKAWLIESIDMDKSGTGSSAVPANTTYEVSLYVSGSVASGTTMDPKVGFTDGCSFVFTAISDVPTS